MTSRRPLFVVACLALLTACSGGRDHAPVSQESAGVPEEYSNGEIAYNHYCATCHGKEATGTDHGPSFLHRVYEPTHHGDSSFLMAPRTGVRAHHWNFGDMPKVAGVTDVELDQIVAYIRWLQRQAGIR
jgi:cytochrome c5